MSPSSMKPSLTLAPSSYICAAKWQVSFHSRECTYFIRIFPPTQFTDQYSSLCSLYTSSCRHPLQYCVQPLFNFRKWCCIHMFVSPKQNACWHLLRSQLFQTQLFIYVMVHAVINTSYSSPFYNFLLCFWKKLA